ncbi:dipeptide ABC transporter ATP-binding protein [uncultured Marinobacter sp.]|uniref:ABC transporter ATP-binding protein n=1 Tax=uncultured Marinobacter sp. TaxID=187379 RepID=UPI0030D9D22F
MPEHDVLLDVQNLTIHFKMYGGLMGNKVTGTVKAVDGVSFQVRRGETLGVVGESGCGKSTTGLGVLRMVEPTAGKVVLDGTDLTSLNQKEMRKFRRKMQMVYQDPFGALDPRMRVLDIVGEPLLIHGLHKNKGEYKARVHDLLERVGLNPNMANRYPHQFSGGQRQRIGIARALAAEPDLIICDEPVSALDVSIQAQVINLLEDLQEEFGLTYLFIAHDLAVVKHICDRIMVMYLGHVVEITTRDALYDNPQHPYTQALMSAIPIPDPDAETQRQFDGSLQGEIPSPMNPPSGCPFHTRCQYAHEACSAKKPVLMETETGHQVACHLYDPSASDVNADDVMKAPLARTG